MPTSTPYESLAKWADDHNMLFRVEDADGDSCTLWMCDAVDGYLGAECVRIDHGVPTWMHYRFRMRKNEQFVNKFLALGEYVDVGWIGHEDKREQVTLPPYYSSQPYTFGDTDGILFFLENIPSEDVMDALKKAGCTMLWSHPMYAPEIKHRVVFVPNDVRIRYA